MLKAIIIDDEENARITLNALLQEYAPEVEVMAQCANVPEGVLAINKHNPDVVFFGHRNARIQRLRVDWLFQRNHF